MVKDGDIQLDSYSTAQISDDNLVTLMWALLSARSASTVCRGPIVVNEDAGSR